MPIVSNFPASGVAKHNVSPTAHEDIRNLLNEFIISIMNGDAQIQLLTASGEELTTNTSDPIMAHKKI